MIDRDIILGNLVRAVHILEESKNFVMLMPEVRINIVYALENASKPEDVAAIDGRITLVKNRVKAAGYPRFGASSHMARLIINIMKYDPDLRAGINFLWTPELSRFLQRYAKEKGWLYAYIDREKEPVEIRDIEGMSMPWKVRELINFTGGEVPRLFCETPGWGKEPLTVLLGRSAVEVALEAVEISNKWANYSSGK